METYFKNGPCLSVLSSFSTDKVDEPQGISGAM